MFRPGIEATHHLIELGHVEVAVKGRDDRLLQQLLDYPFFFGVPDRFKLDLAGSAADDGVQVGNTGSGKAFAQPDRPAQRIAKDVFVVADGHTRTDAATLADVGATASFVRHLGYDFLHKTWHDQFDPIRLELHGLLLDDLNFVFNRARIVSTNFATKTVFQRCHDPSPIGIIFRGWPRPPQTRPDRAESCNL